MLSPEITLNTSFTLTKTERDALYRSGMVSDGVLVAHLLGTVEAEVARMTAKGARGLKADALIERGELEVGRAMIDNTGKRRTFKLLKGRSR